RGPHREGTPGSPGPHPHPRHHRGKRPRLPGRRHRRPLRARHHDDARDGGTPPCHRDHRARDQGLAPAARPPPSPRKETQPTPEPRSRSERRPLSRRTLMTAAGLTAAALPAASLLGHPAASAATTAASPATAPVPPPAKGPAIPKSGYLVQEIAERTYWL